MAQSKSSEYGADQFQVLEQLEPVWKRPGMYIGSTDKAGLHHLIWEIVDNSVDEVMAGHADHVTLTLNPDNSITVVDNGRGIPVEPYTKGEHKGKPVVEVACTVLHAGGKFDDTAYAFSGGLHGVGISVVNALSNKMSVQVTRDGVVNEINFGAVDVEINGRPEVKPGQVLQPLHAIGKAPAGESGTTVTFLPDPRVFSTTEWDYGTIARRLRQGAYLNAGLTFHLIDNRPGQEKEQVTFQFPNGLIDFMDDETTRRTDGYDDPAKKERVLPLAAPVYLSGADADIKGSFEMCIRWFPDNTYIAQSFANGIETRHHGTHVKGYERSLTMLMNRYARQDHISLLNANESNLEAVDVRSGLHVIISAKVKEPQFVGQTKGELSNPETEVMVRQGFSEQFWDWMQDNPAEAKAILEKCIDEMRLRRKLAAQAESARASMEKRGTAPRSGRLPDKLTDASTRDRTTAELFIVEGNSAAGPALNAKQRNSATQAVLPIRGKGLNIERALHDPERIDNNKEVQDMINTMGAGSFEHFDLDAIRYGKVIILTDADDDGRHIQILLMTMFYRLMPELVQAGKLYVARSPLHTTVVRDQRIFLYTDGELEELRKKHPNIISSRFKGLGEMNPDQLGETALDPATRKLVKVTIEDASLANEIIEQLMGNDTDAKWDAINEESLSVEML